MATANAEGRSEETKPKARSSYQMFRDRWGLTGGEMSPQERRRVLEQLFPGEHRDVYRRRFSTLLALSTVIAFCGLQANSTAVVIGAMLVAPLMEPILAMAGAMVMNWRSRLLRSAILVALGCVLTIGLAALLGTLTPDRVVVVPEVMARTSPTLLDLGVALGAGAAGAYTTVKRISAGAAGVAIAVALVPPLTVVGITLEEGRYAMAGSALLLFATNLLAIVLAATVVLLLSGFSPKIIRERSGKWIQASLSTTLVGVLLIAVPLTLYTSYMFRKDRIRDAVFDSVDEWSGFLPQRVVGIGLQGDTIVVDLVSEIEPPATQALANNLASRLGEDVRMRLRWIEFAELDVTGQFRGRTREIRRFRPRTFEEIY